MLFSLSGLRYRYRSRDPFMLGPLDCTIDTTRVTALIGANGGGKTTLIKILLRLAVDIEGSFSIDGAEVADIRGDMLSTHGIGYAPEDPVLDEELTGVEILELVRQIRSIARSRFESVIQELKALLRVESWLSSRPCAEYSQGMRRKTALMIAFLGGERFLVLDEPTNGLDPIAVFGLKKLLRGRRDVGVGALVSSHVLDFVEKQADELLMLHRGRIAFAGTQALLRERWPADYSLDHIYAELADSSAPDS
jgi:ABC-type multidrug transport system ATPase subunit